MHEGTCPTSGQRTMTTNDHHITSKRAAHPPNSIPTPIYITGDFKGFFEAVKWVSRQKVPAPKPSLFSFEYTHEAAIKNSLILEKHGYDLEKAFAAQQDTIVTYGSEVRPTTQLEPLLHNHPNFERFKSNMTHGISCPLNDIPEETRIEEMQKTIKHGNHKSALEKEAIPHVSKAMQTDVVRGFGIIMTPDCAAKLKDAEIYPLGLQHQLTINEFGETIPKKRVCHDLSNNRNKGLSINQRVKDEEVPEVMFGWTLIRVLHKIHHLRINYPNERILMNKVDIEKAYRRIHTSAKTAAKCIALWSIEDDASKEKQGIAVALARLPFGSSPAPAEFSNCSDITFDLANDLLYCSQWDPQELPCPLHDQIPPPKRLPDDTPFGHAEPCCVHQSPNFKGGTDGYIDDGANVVLDSDENAAMVKRAEQNLTMALHLQFRPHAGEDEPIPRGEMASMPKLKAEAYLTEVIIFLGWEINTRAFTIALPFEKEKAWTKQVEGVIAMKRIPYKTIAQLVGRLNHVAYIIPSARHFMGRLRKLEAIADKRRFAKITGEAKKDLRLWLRFLDQAREGISINNIVFRKTTSLGISDACETGIGGFGYETGVAWRYEFTNEEQVSFELNQKEFLASAINQKIQLDLDTNAFPCTNDVTDNTSTAAWMHKSNFDPETHPIHNEIARWSAENLLDRQASSFSQWLEGSENDIADSLSRDHDLSNDQLIALFTHTNPPYLPQKSMKIVKLPDEITSWIASLAQLRTKKRELKWQRTPSTLARGITGWSSANTSGQLTPIFADSWKPKEYASRALSHTQYDEEISLPRGILLKETPRKRPLKMWRRPSFSVVGKTRE